MVRATDANLAMIRHVAEHFGHLRDRVVFLGGAATALLITDPATRDVRVTTDVDVIVEVVSQVDYYHLAESLRTLNFTEDATDGAPLCRWQINGLAVDIMPTDMEILGFGNQWYSQALHTATTVILPTHWRFGW